MERPTVDSVAATVAPAEQPAGVHVRIVCDSGDPVSVRCLNVGRARGSLAEHAEQEGLAVRRHRLRRGHDRDRSEDDECGQVPVYERAETGRCRLPSGWNTSES